jgi:transposase
MLKGPTHKSRRLSKKSWAEVGEAGGSPSGGEGRAVGLRRGAIGPQAGSKASMGSGGKEAHRSLQQRLQVDLSLRIRLSPERRGLLANFAHRQRGVVLDGCAGVRQRGGSSGEEKHILLVLDQAGWHTGREVELPEGIHLEFLPKGSPELQPAERLWPLTNEAIANRLFEEIEEIEEALVKRCVELLDQAESITELTNYHWWPQAA